MLLWLIAAVIAVIGIVQLIQGQIVLAIVLFVVACLVGPGGYSLFRGPGRPDGLARGGAGGNRHGRRRHGVQRRATEEEALGSVAAECPYPVELPRLLDALGHHLEAEGAGQVDDRLHEHLTVG